MDLLYALRMLRKRWKWAVIALIPAAFLALSTAYHVGPSGIHKKSLEYGAAQAQLLVDSPQSTVASTGGDVVALANQAQVFAQLYQANPVVSAIAQRMHLPTSDIAVTVANTNPNIPTAYSGPTAGKANTGLLQEADSLQLLVVPQPNLPLITLYAQGPTGTSAAALANAGANALSQYIAGLKTFIPSKTYLALLAQHGAAPPSHVTVRQLGTAEGAMVNSGASKMIAGLAFVGLVILICVLVIMMGGFVDRIKERKALEDAGLGAEPPVAAAHE